MNASQRFFASADLTRCPSCGGQGEVDGDGNPPGARPCDTCLGRGWLTRAAYRCLLERMEANDVGDLPLFATSERSTA